MIAQAKVASEKPALPPSERAFEVYRLIEVDGLSTRAAAQQVELSQTRVIQLRDWVETWVARQPSAAGGLTKQQRLQAAEYKAGLRLDHLYSLALEAYRNSQGPEAVCEEATGGARVMKTRFSHGNTRYLQMAMRIAAQQSRIPVTPIVDEPDLVQDSPGNPATEGASPPEEVCSPTASEQGGSDAPAGEAADAKSATVSGSARAAAKPADVSEHFADDFFPVQNEARTAERHSLATPVLTRKERKRRARLLAGLRRK